MTIVTSTGGIVGHIDGLTFELEALHGMLDALRVAKTAEDAGHEGLCDSSIPAVLWHAIELVRSAQGRVEAISEMRAS